MNEQEKSAYRDEYTEAKKKGVPFYPDILFKDVLISFLIFLLLVGLSYFVGAPLEERANPADTNYTPRPEWYFLFLFQLLKYFPGNLEVIGVFILPTLAIILLAALPLLDRSARRHAFNRPAIMIVTAFLFVSVIALTTLSIRESPPPAEVALGDPVAALYTKNCAPCHGPTISVSSGTNLHDIIARGSHEGMPAWSADLTSDQIDALAGFILSPAGSSLFRGQCGSCHEVAELVAGDPLNLKNILDEGPNNASHQGVEVPDWSQTITPEEQASLLNFLLAPDGQRLFAINCSPCHGRSVPYTGDEDGLIAIIKNGGMHLDMPPWQKRLSEAEIDTLATYVTEPSANPDAASLFKQNCSSCHGDRIPTSQDIDQARQVISEGGSHETMPVWGDILTDEQILALTSYTLEAASGTPVEVGQELFASNCANCHGDLGEGGPSPVRAGDIIAPISSGEYLKTRDDFTLRSIISQGQPNFGMSPFGTAFGGPLEDDEIDAIVAYMRAWEQNPPVEQPPEFAVASVSLSGQEIFQELCSQCHGSEGEGLIGPSLSSSEFQQENSDQAIFDTINLGHEASAMIGWGEVLTSGQIQELVKFIRQLEQQEPPSPSVTPSSRPPDVTPSVTPPAVTSPGTSPTFTADILPIFKESCNMCHGSLGGWDGSSYQSVMTTGDHAPVVIPGDVEESILAQKLLDEQTFGTVMPPGSKLPEAEIQVILDWIAAGAPEN